MAFRGPSGRSKDGLGQDAPDLRTGAYWKYVRIRRNTVAQDWGAAAAPAARKGYERS